MSTLHIPVTYTTQYQQLTITIGETALAEKIRLVVAEDTSEVIAYQTTDGKFFTTLNPAIKHQIDISVNHSPIDNMLILWRTNKDFPFFCGTGLNGQDRFKHLRGRDQPDGTKKVFIKSNYSEHSDSIINHTDTTVLVVDKFADRVLLIPAGQTVVIPERL